MSLDEMFSSFTSQVNNSGFMEDSSNPDLGNGINIGLLNMSMNDPALENTEFNDNLKTGMGIDMGVNMGVNIDAEMSMGMNLGLDNEDNHVRNNIGNYIRNNDEIDMDMDMDIKGLNLVQTMKPSPMPTCGDIYISTKTKIAYMSHPVPIRELFWDIPITPYFTPKEGIIKKQMKITCMSKEELEEVNKKISGLKNARCETVMSFDNPKSKTNYTFKHVQKVNVGICKKDMISYRNKEKGAFYNCFALIMRVWNEEQNEFTEVHLKVFNTGKMEIPGTQSDSLIRRTFDILVNTMNPLLNHMYMKKNVPQVDLKVDTNTMSVVLINSNFHCGYYINRHNLFQILKYKYNLITMYDPCSYPGIQTKFYYNEDNPIQDGICRCSTRCTKKGSGKGHGQCKEISFMVFRTGSILIVGNCDENVLMMIYKFLKDILEKYYPVIQDGLFEPDTKSSSKRIKIRYIYVK